VRFVEAFIFGVFVRIVLDFQTLAMNILKLGAELDQFSVDFGARRGGVVRHGRFPSV
jgi:hypothetical protein